jgi:Tfp pilus assembly protein PilF
LSGSPPDPEEVTMNKLKTVACAVCAALAGAGCSLMPAEREAWRIEPHKSASAAQNDPIALYREALRRNPLDVEAYNGLGVALSAQGRHDDAIRQFQAAIVLAPGRAAFHNNLGYAYLLRGSYPEAVRELREARRLDPANQKALENLELASAWLPPARAKPAEPVAKARALQPPSDSPANLVQVAPHVYELKAPPPPIVAKTLPPLAEAQVQLASAAPSLPVQPGAPLRNFRLEVSNGNGVNGLAKRVSGLLQAAGVATARLTNHVSFTQPTTEIQYREGYAREAARLAAMLRQPVRAVPSDKLAGHIDVRLVLGHDARSETALVGPARTLSAALAVKPAI